MTKDYSFLRLSTDFNQAKSDNMTDSDMLLGSTICLHPQETYLQISNTEIAFDDSYKAELINCKGEILKDITSKVFINEFLDGYNKIAFEIIPIQEDFYFEKLYLKLTHTASDLIVYSNSFFVTAESEKNTFRLDYKSYREYKGTNYVLADFYQSIRLFGYLNGVSEKKDSKVYTEVNGKVRKSRIVQSFEYGFNIDYINTQTFENLAVALENDLVYINGVKAEVIETLSAGERIAKTNVFDCNFKTQLDETETYLDSFQIAPIFNFIELLPLGVYTTAPTEGSATYNYTIPFSGVLLKLYNYNTDALISEIEILIVDNVFTFDLPTLSNGKYYFLLMGSINDKNTWTFEITNGEFESSEFSNEFLIN